jgi:MtN3 and saliva related transmembrane protein
LPEYLGYIAGFLTTFCYIPQLFVVFRTRSTRDISLLFTVLVFIGCAVWLLYGIYLSLFPVILWNAIVLVLDATLIGAKLRYG